MLEKALKNFVRIDAVGFRMEVQQNAVAQHRNGQRDDVILSHLIAQAGQCELLTQER
jgi:hypothetical protein